MSVTAPESGVLPPSSLVEFPKAKKPRAKRPTARDMLAISERGARRQGHQFDQLTNLMREMSAKWQAPATSAPTVQHVYNAPVVVINIAHDASPDALRALGEGLRNSNATLALQGQNVSSGELKNVSPVQVDSVRPVMDVPVSSEPLVSKGVFDAKAHHAYGILSEQLAQLVSFYENFFQFNLMEWLAQHPGFEEAALKAHDEEPGYNRLIIIPSGLISGQITAEKLPYPFSKTVGWGFSKNPLEKWFGGNIWTEKSGPVFLWTRDTLFNVPVVEGTEQALEAAVNARNALPCATPVEFMLHDWIAFHQNGKRILTKRVVFPSINLESGKAMAEISMAGEMTKFERVRRDAYDQSILVSPVNRFTVASATK